MVKHVVERKSDGVRGRGRMKGWDDRGKNERSGIASSHMSGSAVFVATLLVVDAVRKRGFTSILAVCQR